VTQVFHAELFSDRTDKRAAVRSERGPNQDDVPIRKGWRKLTRNEIAGMRNHYAAGVSIRRIAIAYGVDWSTVWRRCSDVRK
jgi:hypothetical protein